MRKLVRQDDHFYNFVFNLAPITKTSVPNARTFNF